MKCQGGIRWYAVHTQAQRETVAEQTISTFCRRVFLPRYRKRMVLHGYRRIVSRPLFPGYLFAAFDAQASFRAIHYAHGVRGVVCVGPEPAEIPHDLLAAIEARMHDGFVVLDPPRFAKGQRVEIVAGPFAGYQALFQEHLRDGERVAVLLDCLSYAPRAELDRDWIRAVS